MYETSKSAYTVTHLLQQGYAYSNKATPRATPFKLMGANYTHTTTQEKQTFLNLFGI